MLCTLVALPPVVSAALCKLFIAMPCKPSKISRQVVTGREKNDAKRIKGRFSAVGMTKTEGTIF